MKRMWGKVVGTGLGFVLGGGPLGALFGMLVGHAYDTRDRAKDAQEDLARQSAFANFAHNTSYMIGIVTLSAKMAKVDGKVTRDEIDAFRTAFRIKPEQENYISGLFDKARVTADGFEPYAFQMAQMFAARPAALEQILGGLFAIAAADENHISPKKAGFLKRVAYIFNIMPGDFLRIARQAGVKLPSEDSIRDSERAKAQSDYAILGISQSASNDEIKASYRALIVKHHPDKLIAEGKPPELVASASEKVKLINAAYDKIARSRGIK